MICTGQWPTHESTANEATHELGGYRDWSSRRTCKDLTFWTWDVANRRTTSPNSLQFYFIDFFHARYVRCRNLGLISTIFSKKWFPLRWLWRWLPSDTFTGLFTDPFLSSVTGLFLHARCIPQQNSQWQLWASARAVCIYIIYNYIYIYYI